MKKAILILSFLLSKPALAQTCQLLCNGSFDSHNITSSVGLTVTVNCWQTMSTDGLMEVWGTGFNGVNSYDGIQHVELNGTQAAAMFQDFNATANAQLTIGFAHRGRAGTDSMQVLAGPVGGPYTSLGIYGDGVNAWGYYTVPYTTQSAGAYRLLFKPIYWSGNNVAIGNFLDAVSVTATTSIISAAANKTLVCAGDQVVLTATGAQSYTWSGGPAAATYTLNLFANGVYTVTGGSPGCSGTSTVSLQVYQPTMSLSASALTVCAGSNVTLTANTFGGASYKWNGVAGQYTTVVSPTVSTLYTAAAFSASNTANCPVSASISIGTLPLPAITVNATKKFVCKNAPPAILTASGGQAYLWSTGATSSTIQSLPVSTLYTVTGTGQNGCKASATVSVQVSECLGVPERMAEQVRVFPNPGSGEVSVTSEGQTEVILMSELGQLIGRALLNAENNFRTDLGPLAAGIYFLRTANGETHKIVVTK